MNPLNVTDPTGQDGVDAEGAFGVFREIVRAARSGGIGYDKVINHGCDGGDTNSPPCNKNVLDAQLTSAFFYIALVPKGKELINRLSLVNIWQARPGQGDSSTTGAGIVYCVEANTQSDIRLSIAASFT